MEPDDDKKKEAPLSKNLKENLDARKKNDSEG